MRQSASRSILAVLLGLILLNGVILASDAAGGPTSVVLGSAMFAKPYGEGWGTARPPRLFNGGDPSGLVTEIRWTSWSGNTAIGYGLNSIFKPAGGYYSQPVIVELRAQKLGRCGSHGPRAYTQLAIRGPARPEGPLGPWHLWSEAKSLCQFGF
jgi:hypothetical protein